MNKKLLFLFGVLLFGLLVLSSQKVSAYHEYNYGHDGYYGYSDTYYKKTSYDMHGSTVEIRRDSPYRSYYSVRSDAYYRPVHFQSYRINHAPSYYGRYSGYYPSNYYGYDSYGYRYNSASNYWRYGY